MRSHVSGDAIYTGSCDKLAEELTKLDDLGVSAIGSEYGADRMRGAVESPAYRSVAGIDTARPIKVEPDVVAYPTLEDRVRVVFS